MFLGLPDPDPLVRGTDVNLASKTNKQKKQIFCCNLEV